MAYSVQHHGSTLIIEIDAPRNGTALFVGITCSMGALIFLLLAFYSPIGEHIGPIPWDLPPWGIALWQHGASVLGIAVAFMFNFVVAGYILANLFGYEEVTFHETQAEIKKGIGIIYASTKTLDLSHIRKIGHMENAPSLQRLGICPSGIPIWGPGNVYLCDTKGKTYRFGLSLTKQECIDVMNQIDRHLKDVGPCS